MPTEFFLWCALLRRRQHVVGGKAILPLSRHRRQGHSYSVQKH